ncbi:MULTISPECIES: CHAT domain-containing protein [unclassified Bradyrhizobium]|uniref:CHAT domain-containing protein n=1 Tax=unclassified Bradyrhizobium TaxID=2631580 RepID=UPI002915D307|nr:MULTISPECIES: CHAT domain-containing protein [unclassified Bradyrhizobium]
MPIRQIPRTDLQYCLIIFDESGRERPEPDGTLLSDVVLKRVKDPAAQITDVFMMSHGWMGDVPAAIDQYDKWLGAVAAHQADRTAVLAQRPGFQPLIIGLHWPSLPFGDETIQGGAGMLLGEGEPGASIEALTEFYATRIADTPAARDAIRSILQASRPDLGATTLPPALGDAYTTVFAESGLVTGDASAAPGSDQVAFDPAAIVAEAHAEAAELNAETAAGLLGVGESLRDALLAPLRVLSFWKMKDRARAFGEGGAHAFLEQLQLAAPAARVHLMGHSFGCIVVSAAVAGPPGAGALSRPVDSLFLVQGALSLWSFADAVPAAQNAPGYFRRIMQNDLVRGPIVTTRSEHDRAVGFFYPLGARARNQLVLDMEYPAYGGLGTFGMRGTKAALTTDRPVQSPAFAYNFEGGRVYNIEASRIIKNGGGLSGAHSDIAHLEVAHLFWAAVLAGQTVSSQTHAGGGGLLGLEHAQGQQQQQQQQQQQEGGSEGRFWPGPAEQVQVAAPRPLEPEHFTRGGGIFKNFTASPAEIKGIQDILESTSGSFSIENDVGAPATTEEVKAAPPGQQRWVNAGFEDLDAPLQPGQWYSFAFDVDIVPRDASAVPLAEQQLFPEGTTEVVLTVKLDSSDFEIPADQQSKRLTLPRRGKSRKARFDISPRHLGPSALKATIHKDGNFVQQIDLTINVGQSVSPPEVKDAHGRPYASANVLKPRDVGLSIMPTVGGYECLVWKPVGGRARLPLSADYLAKAIETARQELMKVVSYTNAAGTPVFQTGIDIRDGDRDAALKIMARAGAALFQKLFYGPGAGEDSKAVGNFLRSLVSDRKRQLTLQVMADATSIPWGLLYVGDVATGAQLDWDNFIGMRHVIEQIPMQVTPLVFDCLIPSDQPELSVSINMNDDIDRQMHADFVAQQHRFWDSARTERGSVRVTPRTTSAELVHALANENTDDQILYFYCHAQSTGLNDPGGPDSSCLVLTDDKRITLGDLNLDAPTSKLLRGKPLVFINACESAELSPAFYDGFVPYFMAKGARGVIGTECKTPALFATAWAKRFFERFLDGEPLGEVFLGLRQEFLKQHGNPLGLLYAVHCDGDTQIAPALPRSSSSPPQSVPETA